MSTNIEWTDETWNPTRGCSRVSEGCRNCYAERVAARFNGTKIVDGKRELRPFAGFAIRTGHGPQWTGRVELIESKLTEPLHWKKPRRVFVDSMSDLWHEKLSAEDQADTYGIMAMAYWHEFQVLTKRPENRLDQFSDPMFAREVESRARDYISKTEGIASWRFQWPLPNVWEGVSVENQPTADARIPELLRTPAALRFFSYEPALGPVDFTEWISCKTCFEGRSRSEGPEGFGCTEVRLDWGIVGGESGPQARPCDLAWIESTVDQFAAAGVPLFVKQVGARAGYQRKHGWHDIGLSDSKGGNMCDWPEKIRVREFPR